MSYLATKIRDVSNVVSGGTPDTSNPNYWDGEINWFTPSEIGNSKYVENSKRRITSLGYKNCGAKLMSPGSILLSSRATVGDASISKTECCTNQGFQSLTDFKCCGQYLYYYLQTYRIHKSLIRRASGSTFLEISNYEVGNTDIFIPDLNIQEKIAIFLSKIDDRIETQNKIIEELQSLRKAIYYEQIKGAKKEEMMISDICDIGRGRVISQQEIAKQNNPIYPVFSSQTLNNGIMGYLDNYDFDGEYVTWTTDGANAGTVFYHNGKFNCTNVCGTLKTNSEKVIPYYLFLALSHEAKRYVSTNLGNPKLMNGTMAKIKIKVPSIVVQKTVVNGSMILDRLIDIETKILNALSSQKSYFLANLFI